MRTSMDILTAARGCVGARFRPHGRDPAFGLDCIGVAAIAFDREVPGDYALRGGDAEAIAKRIDASGLVRINSVRAEPVEALSFSSAAKGESAALRQAQRGREWEGEELAPADLLLIHAGPHQYHLAILTPEGFIHADAWLRRVVETPGTPANILAAWREVR